MRRTCGQLVALHIDTTGKSTSQRVYETPLCQECRLKCCPVLKTAPANHNHHTSLPAQTWPHVKNVFNSWKDYQIPVHFPLGLVYSARKRPVHTETFSCVFVSFQVNELVVLDSLENSKQYKNAGKRFRVYGGQRFTFKNCFTFEIFVQFSSQRTLRKPWRRLTYYVMVRIVSSPVQLLQQVERRRYQSAFCNNYNSRFQRFQTITIWFFTGGQKERGLWARDWGFSALQSVTSLAQLVSQRLKNAF